MRLYFCAIVTLVEMFDTSYSSAIVGKLLDVFSLSFVQLSNLYISLAVGASLSLPLTKYCYRVFKLATLYKVLIIILLINFTWAFATNNWFTFCFLRTIQGFCLTLLYSVSFLDVVTTSQDKDKAINLINGISVLGLISGPALGGYITLIGWKFIFVAFNLILGWLLFSIWKLDLWESSPTTSNFSESSLRRVTFYDLIEYICFVLVITLGSLLIDGLISLKFIPIILLCSVVLSIKYKRFSDNFILHNAIFNRQLLYSVIIHVLSRFSVVAFIPLLTTILYRDYNYSTIKISLLLSLAGIASLAAKLVYRQFKLHQNYQAVIFFIHMAILGSFAASPFRNIWLVSALFFGYGLFSSIIFNYINSYIFLNQPEELTNDLSVILTLLQMLLYGLSTTLIFKFFSQLQTNFNTSQTSFAIIILFMVYTSSLALYIYKVTQKKNAELSN